jgi:hypothetical protein
MLTSRSNTLRDVPECVRGIRNVVRGWAQRAPFSAASAL